jgi:hypothetical protein
LLLGSALIVAGVVWGVLHVTQLKGGDQANASSYGQFLLAAIGLLIIVGGWLTKGFASAPEPTLDDLADLLALAMRNQAEKTAIERRLIQPAPMPIHWEPAIDPIAGPISAARDGQAWFDPLPGLTHITPEQLQGGDRAILHSVYGGLPYGRLIITGGPGAGKSSAAVLLQLDALRFREQAATDDDRRRIPVPVIFTLQGWDPATTSVEDWLITKLVQIPLLAGRHGPRRARTLLRDKRIAVFLDGFDEIPETLGPHVLRALSDQSTFRVVLLGRRTELVDAAQKQILVGSIALQLKPLTPTATVEYLMQPLTEPPPEPWQRVATTVSRETTSPLACALTLPFWVSLLHDIYPPAGPLHRPVDELLDIEAFPYSESITEHLLDHAVTAAYTPVPGRPPPRYTPETARRTLTVIANQLCGQRDLAWWLIPNFLPRLARGLLSAIMVMILYGTAVSVMPGPGTAFFDVLAGMLTLGMVAGGASWVARSRPPLSTRGVVTEFRRARTIVISLAAALPLGFILMLAFGVVIGFPIGFIIGLMLVAAYVLGRLSIRDTNPADPITQWRDEFLIGLAYAVLLGILITLLSGQVRGFPAGISAGVAGVLVGLISVGSVSLAACRIYLTMRYRTPLRLMRFLEDARARHLVRTVGPVYQFRHATLQDRLRATSGVVGTPEVAPGGGGRSAAGAS